MSRLVLLVAVLLAVLSVSRGLVHHLSIRNDHRNMFKIESFGFLQGGTMQLDISDFNVRNPSTASTHAVGKKKSKALTEKEMEAFVDQMDSNSIRRLDNSKNTKLYDVGFLFRHAHSESAASQDLERLMDRNECILDKRRPNDIYIDMSDPSNWKKVTFLHQINDEDEIGFYTLIFVHCNVRDVGADILNTNTNSHGKTTSDESTIHFAKNFKLDVIFRNPGPNYLSAGDAPLPMIYFAFFIAFALAMGAWMYVLSRGLLIGAKDRSSKSVVISGSPTVTKIHYLMLALIAVKVLTLLFESIRYHYIARYGVSEGWSVIYYFFATLKGVMLFTVILLIGSGYSLMKGYLNDNEKKVIYTVLVLQVVDNIAMIILEETAPGSESWLTWKDILHLVDILCCAAILLPIIWSIRHLRQAAEVDGKAHNSLTKLNLFRQFYIVVVMFVYFTRIAVFLIESTMPFYLEWLGAFFTELAALVFYTYTGYQFRPKVDNPYLVVNSEDMEGREYGLDDDDGVFDSAVEIELATPYTARKK